MDLQSDNETSSSNGNSIASSTNEDKVTENTNNELDVNKSSKNSVTMNQEIHNLIETINENNKNNIEKLSNAFLKAVEEMKFGNKNIFRENSNYNENNDEGTSNINTVPSHKKFPFNFNQFQSMVHTFNTPSYIMRPNEIYRN